MSDSRSRAEDRLAEAEENQRQILGATQAPSLARAQIQNRPTPEPEDDGPPIDIRCGPVQVTGGMVYVQNERGVALEIGQDRTKEVWEALTVLIREGVIQ